MENMYDNGELQPGFRFYPTEDELVNFYLRNKLDGKREQDIQRLIPVVNIYHHNPWELPRMAGEGIREDSEQWFFFIAMQEREGRGGRPTRLTTEGYWKATGSPSYVYSSNISNNNVRIIGGKRTMVFYTGRAPHGKKTFWKMNEYRACTDGHESSSVTNSNITHLKLRHEFSLCRVYKKSKCVRSFDRRPSGFGTLYIDEGINNQPINNTLDEAAPSNQNLTLLESSSSGEPAGESVNDLDICGDPLWEWDCNFIN